MLQQNPSAQDALPTGNVPPDVLAVRSALQNALELELSTIPPYLAAMYSIMPGTNTAAAQVILSVVLEEMLHLLLAANLLNAVGGHPDVTTPAVLPSYPIQLKFTDRQFSIDLQKFSPAAIDTFLNIEKPASLRPSAPQTAPEGFPELDVNGLSIGAFYGNVITALQQLCATYGEASVFSGNPKLQFDNSYYYKGGGKVVQVTSLATAIQAIHEIVDQGEASDGTLSDGDAAPGQPGYEVAHYYRFNEIKLGRYYSDTDKPGDAPSGPALEVDYTQVYDMKPNPKQADYPAGSDLAKATIAFNQLYSTFLQQLQAAFNGNLAEMVTATNTMRTIGSNSVALMQTPIPGGGGQYAGPSFEYIGAPQGNSLQAVAPHHQPVYKTL